MRVLGLLLLALGGYYLRFYLVRGDPLTLVQLGIVLAASALLLCSGGLQARWLPVAWQDGWYLPLACFWRWGSWWRWIAIRTPCRIP